MDKASGTVKHFLSSLNSIKEWLASNLYFTILMCLANFYNNYVLAIPYIQ